ncbi:unnamed protein product [Onchocerca ochengi]|uniref:Transmembrane protein n=1 Tax=Onchocerca ochengi TaxID=42157 RepID=A0A182EKP8_ONCOC|nr:unnamed protein product [Onchocerca ochengi]
MTIASAPPYPDRVVVQQVAPTRSTRDESPPTYEDSANPNTLPPTYESLYGEFRQVEDPRGLAQFLAKAFAMIISTMTAAVLLAVLNIIPLGMIVLGSNNVYSCPVEPYIPVWLIVTGFFSLLKSATNFCYRAKRHREGRPPSAADVNPNPFDGLLSCFLLVWFIIVSNSVHYYIDVDSFRKCPIVRLSIDLSDDVVVHFQGSLFVPKGRQGSVWVYSVYDEVQYSNSGDSNYCDQFTYIFSVICHFRSTISNKIRIKPSDDCVSHYTRLHKA